MMPANVMPCVNGGAMAMPVIGTMCNSMGVSPMPVNSMVVNSMQMGPMPLMMCQPSAVAIVVNVPGPQQPSGFMPSAMTMPMMMQAAPAPPQKPLTQEMAPNATRPPCQMPLVRADSQSTASSFGESFDSLSSASELSVSRVPSTTSEDAFPSDEVRGQVYALSQKQTGCRRVQDALDKCSSDHERFLLAQEMVGHVWESVRCPFGNYVIQRFITLLPPRDCQFIIDEISEQGRRAASQLARHRYGCRIMQRLLEHCKPEQTEALTDVLLGEAVPLVRHQYGNFVMQRVLSHGTPKQQRQACQLLLPKIGELANDSNASAVVAKALSHACQEDQKALAAEILSESGLLLAMCKTRHGHQTALALLQGLSGEELQAAVGTMKGGLDSLPHARYGRVVLRSIPALSEMCMSPEMTD